MKISKLKLSLLLITVLLFAVFSLTSCEELLASLGGAHTPGDTDNAVEDDGADDSGKTECKHFWINYVTITRPTCGTNETGITQSTCKHCSATREQVTNAYVEHHIEKEVFAAKCGEDGYLIETCRNCDYYYKETLLALEHTYKLMADPNSEGLYGFMCKYCYDLQKHVSVVTYEDFGAVGDGVTDDSNAIRAAHEAANECGLPVRAKSRATYYIGPILTTIKIKTDTDWNGAKFIFDDHQIPWDNGNLRGVHVFTVAADEGSKKITVPPGYSLTKGQTNVGMTFDEPCLLKVVNASKKIYIRYGANANNGANQYELILVDRNGNVDPSTPIQYDYDVVTEMVAYCVVDKPITVGNGTIVTIAPNPKEYDPSYENNYCYYKRGIVVNRSNTTLYNIQHSIVGEDMTVELDRDGDGVIEKWGDDKSYGVPYSGFFTFSGCANVTMTDCLVQGHQAYSFWQDGGLTRNEMGSYDISASDTVNLYLLNIVQYENKETGEVITNRFMYHGVMGSNFCRNIVMDNCYLDRFDSHQGLHNAKITNSTLGFGILVIGGGELYIENVYRITEGAFILLRTDYNSVFDGDLIIKNCTMGPTITSVISGSWRSFYNGLPNYMFRSVTIEGLTVESTSSTIYVYQISSASKSAVNDSVNKLFLPDSIKVSGVTGTSGRSVTVKASKSNTDAFSTVTVTKE